MGGSLIKTWISKSKRAQMEKFLLSNNFLYNILTLTLIIISYYSSSSRHSKKIELIAKFNMNFSSNSISNNINNLPNIINKFNNSSNNNHSNLHNCNIKNYNSNN